MPQVISRLVLAAGLFATAMAGAAPIRVATNAPATRPSFSAFGDLLLYQGRAPATGKELWRSDGTVAGTFLVRDLWPGDNSSSPESFTAVNGVAFYRARDEPHGLELWRTGGTETSTVLVQDIVPGIGFSSPVALSAVDGALYFSASDGSQYGVYRTDPNGSGATLLRNGLPPGGGNVAEGYTKLGDRVIFAASDGTDSGQLALWRTDGTPQGTQPVGSSVKVAGNLFVPAKGALYFIGHGGDFLRQVWKTDGTPGGTTQVSSLEGGAVFAFPDDGSSSVPSLGGWVYFLGTDAAGGQELWRTDGSSGGSQRVADICPGSCGSSPRLLTPVGDVLYFVANDGQHGLEVWRTQGTAATTWMLKDIQPGIDGSQPWHLVAAGGRLFFGATGGEGRTGLWVSDGSEAGTRLRAAFALPPRAELFNWVAATTKGLFIATDSVDVPGQVDLYYENLGCLPGDGDLDGIPDCVEETEGLDAQRKDNDVFAMPRLFAMQQYRDFLGREGDAAGVDFWTGQLASNATTRAKLIQAFFDSPEFQATGSPLVRLYLAYFVRIPDHSGLDFWMKRLRSGQAIEAISDFFAASPEFNQRYGELSNAAFVDRVYRNVFAREPDAGGRAHWLGRLESGQITRGQMMLGLSESEEFRQLVDNEVYVTMLYVGMLRRTPDPAGYGQWVDYLNGGNSREALIGRFLATPEYRRRFLD